MGRVRAERTNAMTCATCRWCLPASDAKAARAYVRCTVPIGTPVLPTIGDRRAIVTLAIREAVREPRNWTTLAHVRGEISGLGPAGHDCELFEGTATP